MVRRSSRLAKEAKKSTIPKQAPKKIAPKKAKKVKTPQVALKKIEAELKKCKTQLATEKSKRTKDRKEISTWKSLARKTVKANKTIVARVTENMKLARKSLKDAQIAVEQCKVCMKGAQESHNRAEHFRQKCLDMTNAQVNQEVRNRNGEPFPWQSCEICLIPYGHEEGRTPRVLACGHTLCLECCQKVERDDVSEDRVLASCPFCKTLTRVKKPMKDNVPKNFAVLDMCN